MGAVTATNIQDIIDAVEVLSDAEKLAYGNLVWKDYLSQSNLFTSHRVETGVRNGMKIPKIDEGEDFEFMQNMATASDACARIDGDITFTMSEKTYNSAPYGRHPQICIKALDKKIKDYFRGEVDADGDATGTPMISALSMMLAKKMLRSMWLQVYFGDTAEVNDAFNANDGFFKQLEADIAVGSDNHIDIVENAGASYASQALASDAAFNIFNEMTTTRDIAIFNNSDIGNGVDTPAGGGHEIWCTLSMARNYLNWLNTQKVVNCCERNPLTNTFTLGGLSIWNTPIKVFPMWDNIIDKMSEFNSGTAWDHPHRALLVKPENMVIHSTNADEFESFDIWYSKETRKMNFDLEYTIGAAALESDREFIYAY